MRYIVPCQTAHFTDLDIDFIDFLVYYSIMSQVTCMEQEFERLTASPIHEVEGELIWRNAGAVVVGSLKIGDAYGRLIGCDDLSMPFSIASHTFFPEPGKGVSKRFVNKNPDYRGYTDSPLSVVGQSLHQMSLDLTSGLDLHSVETRATIYRTDKTNRDRNQLLHVDVPERDLQDDSLGKLILILGFPTTTETLVDGYEFEGNANQIFDIDGRLKDQIDASRHLESAKLGKVVMFGARTTVHCTPIHTNSGIEIGTPRVVCKSVIQYKKNS